MLTIWDDGVRVITISAMRWHEDGIQIQVKGPDGCACHLTGFTHERGGLSRYGMHCAKMAIGGKINEREFDFWQAMMNWDTENHVLKT